jgi:hypothetical protein
MPREGELLYACPVRIQMTSQPPVSASTFRALIPGLQAVVVELLVLEIFLVRSRLRKPESHSNTVLLFSNLEIEQQV